MLLFVVSVLVVAQSSLEILEGLMNNPVFYKSLETFFFNNLLHGSIYTTVKMLILLALGKMYYFMHSTKLKIHFVYVGT